MQKTMQWGTGLMFSSLMVLGTYYLWYRPSQERSAAMDLLGCAEALKFYPDQMARGGRCRHIVTQITTLPNHALRFDNQPEGLSLILTPPASSAMNWACQGSPADYFPPQCQ